MTAPPWRAAAKPTPWPPPVTAEKPPRAPIRAGAEPVRHSPTIRRFCQVICELTAAPIPRKLKLIDSEFALSIDTREVSYDRLRRPPERNRRPLACAAPRRQAAARLRPPVRQRSRG